MTFILYPHRGVTILAIVPSTFYSPLSAFHDPVEVKPAMSADLLRPPAHLSSLDALSLSQQAPTILQKQSSWKVPWPLSLVVVSDAPEKWTIIENLFFSCLRTGDNKSALACLEKLKERFGDLNERVMGLTGLYHEAIASDDAALENLLKQYEEAIVDKPTNMVLRKRKIALLRSMGRLAEATAALVQLLDASPIDAESWSELADLYFLQALYPQAVFSLEEVLLITPNAWNVCVLPLTCLGGLLIVRTDACPVR